MRLLLLTFLLWCAWTSADDSMTVELPPPNAAALVNEGTADGESVVMARIGDETITVEDFMGFLSANPAKIEEATTTAGKASLLRNAIENTLLVQAMKREGFLTVDPSDATARQLAFAQLEQKYFPVPPIKDEAPVRQFYSDHVEDFGIPSAVRLSQILIRVPKDATDAQVATARERAEEALARIEGGETFATIAEAYTENNAYRKTGGDVGYVWQNYYDWVREAVDGVGLGEHTRVLRTPAGFEILQVTDRREPILTPYEDARNAVAQRMGAEAQKKARAAYVKRLAQEIGVTIELEELKPAFANGIFL